MSGGGLDSTQVKRFADSDAEHPYADMMLESRLMAITDELSKLEGMERRAKAARAAFNVIVKLRGRSSRTVGQLRINDLLGSENLTCKLLN